MALKTYYMLNGLTSMIHKKIHQIFSDIGGRWKNQWKILVKNLTQRSNKLEKGYSQDLVEQTVYRGCWICVVLRGGVDLGLGLP